MPYVCMLFDVLKKSNARKPFASTLWAIAIPCPWDECELFGVLLLVPANSRSSAGCAASLVFSVFTLA